MISNLVLKSKNRLKLKMSLTENPKTYYECLNDAFLKHYGSYYNIDGKSCWRLENEHQFKRLSGITLPNVEEIDMSNNGLEDLSGIKYGPKTKTVLLRANCLTSQSFCDATFGEGVTTITLCYNDITNLDMFNPPPLLDSLCICMNDNFKSTQIIADLQLLGTAIGS